MPLCCSAHALEVTTKFTKLLLHRFKKKVQGPSVLNARAISSLQEQSGSDWDLGFRMVCMSFPKP